jgi:predicted TIM-barrel enzyme
MREEILGAIRAKVARGEAILAAGAGIGLSAKCASDGGADLIVIYNSGRYRMAGRGSASGYLPFGNANDLVLEMAGEIIPVAGNTPVIAGVCGTDPFCIWPAYFEDLRRAGFAGIQNFPTVGLIDGYFGQMLAETGMGYDLEIAAVRAAHQADLLTAPYAFTPEHAREMALAGADIVVAHMGTTVKGNTGAQTSIGLDEAVSRTRAICRAARDANPGVLVMCHGGPIAEPVDAAYVIERVEGIVGFFGASSVERLPAEMAITQRVREFKQIRLVSLA